jgi:hypothetical protein
MATTCVPAPANKKEYITDIGKILIADYGKQKYYKPEQVKKAHQKSKWHEGLDFSCWGMSTYSSHTDFDKYHEEIGEPCNYVEMKTEMLQGLSSTGTENAIELSALDLDVSWLDFGEAFDGILEGIGELISGIAEGLS